MPGKGFGTIELSGQRLRVFVLESRDLGLKRLGGRSMAGEVASDKRLFASLSIAGFDTKHLAGGL